MSSAPLRSRKSPPGARAESRGPGRPPAPSLQPARSGLAIPIAFKFAVFIAVLVVLFMAWQTRTAMQVAVESQDAAVNESGIKDVTALSTHLEPAWIEDPRLRHRLDDALKRHCAAARLMGVLNAVVYPAGGGSALATGKPGEESFKFSQDPREVSFPAAAAAGVRIHELEYNGEPVRRFSKDLRAARGGQETLIGTVEVLLSARRINQARDAIRDRMMTVAGISALAAAVVSFLLAAFLTYPIRTLARDIRQVSMGQLDHQSRVRSGDEIGDLARAFNHMTQNLQKAQDARVAQKAMEHDLNLATRIQTRLLPAAIPDVPGLDIAAYYHSAREVGGDYYDFLRIDEEHLAAVVADVSGKGVPGSLVMTMTRSLLRLAAAEEESPARTIERVNRILAPDLGGGMFVTLAYLVVHLPSFQVRLVRAGHNAPLLYVAHRNRLLPLQPRGIALGLDAGGALFKSELEVQQFTLQPGDFLVAYTDGIVEAKDARGECYSDERFARRIQDGAAEGARSIIDRVLADVSAHRQAAEQSDDITLLVLKRRGPQR